jgi:hypothetical protein
MLLASSGMASWVVNSLNNDCENANTHTHGGVNLVVLAYLQRRRSWSWNRSTRWRNGGEKRSLWVIELWLWGDRTHPRSVWLVGARWHSSSFARSNSRRQEWSDARRLLFLRLVLLMWRRSVVRAFSREGLTPWCVRSMLIWRVRLSKSYSRTSLESTWLCGDTTSGAGREWPRVI